MNRRVVVTGSGVVTALGCCVEKLWDSVLQGESGISEIKRFDTARLRAKFGGEISDWSPEAYVQRKEAKRLDRFTQFALAAGVDAVSQSGIDFAAEDRFRCGVIIGSGIGGLSELEVQHARLMQKGPEKVSAFTIPKLMANAASGQISIRYGLCGPSEAVVTACASASNAIGNAFKTIQRGDTEVMVTGGSEAALTPLGMAGFCAMRALSERNDAPTAASRPFDLNRDGFILSEGAGAIVIEELEHAKARGATILAELIGFGASADGSHITQPHEDGIGAAAAMFRALADARVDPTKIDYVNAHGTSTPLGDQAETAAIKTVFKEHARVLSISSTKSQLGHLLGASGGVELILCIKAIGEGVIPPTINYETPDPRCDLDYTPNQPRHREVDVIMSNSFGFGGHNASVIARQYRGD